MTRAVAASAMRMYVRPFFGTARARLVIGDL